LNLYTPTNEFEERVPISFIRKIQERLSVVKEPSQSLLMDTKLMFAVDFPYSPSTVSLETIEAPSEWELGFLKKL
jgi:myosin-5